MSRAPVMGLVWALAACGTGAPPADYPDPRGEDDPNAPRVAMAEPGNWAVLTEPVVELTIEASAPGGIAAVSVAVGGGPWERAASAGAGAGWTATVDLGLGANEIELRATTADGERVEGGGWLSYSGQAPAIRLARPWEGAAVGTEGVAVVGVAEAVAPAKLVEVAAGAEPGALEPVEVGAYGEFSAQVDDTGAASPRVVVRATDSEGRETTVTKKLSRDDGPPALTLESPADGAVLVTSLVTVRGAASDAEGEVRVEVQAGEAGWTSAELDPDAGTFEAAMALPPGPSRLTVRALDEAGNPTTRTIHVFRERIVTLNPPAPPGEGEDALLELTLDAAGLKALLPPGAPDDLELLYLDVAGLLEEALLAMKDYEAYGVDTSLWGPAEWNMHEILTMSPDTADVSGTSLESVLALGANLGLPVPQLLADIGDIGVTETFLSVEQVSEGIYENILSTHPGLVVDPTDGRKKIPITLGDALVDLTTLDEKLGPSGDHPGVLFDAAPTKVLLPNFAMTVAARSNLREHDGIDLGAGKTFIFTHRPGEELLDFDFLDPGRFNVVGIADEPEVDLSFMIDEHDGFVEAGTDPEGHPAEGYQRGSSAVWDLPPWTFERMVADMVWRASRDRYAATNHQHTTSYDLGAIEDAASVFWDGGWLTVDTAAGVGDPPPPQYYWDSVLELAQVRLHDGGLAEGDADLRLAITGVRVPLTAEQLVEATRPVLEAQKAEMSALMTGDHANYTSECDIFLALGDDGERYLYYVLPSDVPGLAESHPEAGFFKNVALTERASTTAELGSGDAYHEKVKVSAEGGQVYYAADRDGSVWRLETLAADDGDGGAVRVKLRPAGDGW